MLHTKFRGNQPASGHDLKYGRDGYLGHVTKVS